MGKVSHKNLQQFKRILWAVLLPPLFIAIYLVYTNTWPVPLLMKLQAKWFDGYYYLKATVIAVYIGIIVVFELIPLVVILLSKQIFQLLKRR